ncbi:MAG TPA: rhodanese-like domain-containing protein [Candidatus Baltobacteraceae bacterium]|jgi:rhodanese-related sulfurtransferase|nr:rhodanese-like domain-containing protein [Candidatus Baltobacteraceae bacterium]
MKHVEPHRFDAAAPILDIRAHSHRGQIRGALRYDPKKLLDADRLVLPLPKDGEVVLCADDADVAEAVGRRLHDAGYGEAVLLEGGFDEWKERGLPVEEGTQEQPIPGEPGAGIHRL